MRKLAITAVIASAAILVPAGATVADAAMAPPANVIPAAAVEAAAHLSPTWPARTCQAFGTWRKHQTAAGFEALVIDAAHLGKSYLKADVLQLGADASSPSPKAGKYAVEDERYVSEDCAKV